MADSKLPMKNDRAADSNDIKVVLTAMLSRITILERRVGILQQKVGG